MSLPANNITIGWFLISSGIVFIFSFLFLALMFSTRKPAWGPLNDVTYFIALILISPYLISIFNDHISINPIAVTIAVALGITGIAIISITQTRLVLKAVEFEKNLRQGAFGSGLLGVGFIMIHLMRLNAAFIPAGLNWLGLVSGVLMSMGIPTGLFYGKEELEMTSGKLDWKKANKLAIVSVLSTFIGQIGLIAWVFWLGKVLIKL
jgi:hypothetical protein